MTKIGRLAEQLEKLQEESSEAEKEQSRLINEFNAECSGGEPILEAEWWIDEGGRLSLSLDGNEFDRLSALVIRDFLVKSFEECENV